MDYLSKMIDIFSTLKKTSWEVYTIGSIGLGFGFQAYGLELFFLATIVLFLFSGIDIIYGYYLAHRRKIVLSSIMADGMMRKLLQVLFSFVFGLSIFGVSFTFNNDNVTLVSSIIGILPTVGFLVAQITSIIENLAIGAKGDEKLRISLLLKLAGVGRKGLEEKFNRYIPNQEQNEDTKPA